MADQQKSEPTKNFLPIGQVMNENRSKKAQTKVPEYTSFQTKLGLAD